MGKYLGQWRCVTGGIYRPWKISLSVADLPRRFDFGCLEFWRCAAGISFFAHAHVKLIVGIHFTMPVPLLAEVSDRGISGIPYVWDLIKLLPWLAVLYLLKVYFGGAKCRAERVMHGKVVMITVSIDQDGWYQVLTTPRAEHQALALKLPETLQPAVPKSSSSRTMLPTIPSLSTISTTCGQLAITSSSMRSKWICRRYIPSACLPPNG